MSALLQLAERCEKATGPDRELDASIAEMLDDWRTNERRAIASNTGEWGHLDDERSFVAVPSFSASLDAAMQLVPEGHCGQIQFGKHVGAWVAPLAEESPADFNAAATPALAICAAALRARAAS